MQEKNKEEFLTLGIDLGGSVIEGLSAYLTMAELILRRNALEVAVEELRITTAGLGNKAGAIGAATLARHSLLETREGG